MRGGYCTWLVGHAQRIRYLEPRYLEVSTVRLGSGRNCTRVSMGVGGTDIITFYSSDGVDIVLLIDYDRDALSVWTFCPAALFSDGAIMISHDPDNQQEEKEECLCLCCAPAVYKKLGKQCN